ncbi:hypothetical protein BD324DRAFT_628108 [Kockovaella imperatae]|uniref:Uncharacterized protein n=1 Tax=Kockovaella imperatae TaxID=4999 RepID=A0A1Y1UFI3_9TREE|nr:hypothetical protein BD324DRAFT_628108 [Kockovaella imperatae]ORX36266.1 hypothetical protein BD324DRAFT_628108 [Kockovaella imperatae]
MSFKAHYVFGTHSSFSHVPPVIRLCLALLTQADDLIITVILHADNLLNSERLMAVHPDSITTRLRLVPIGDQMPLKDTSRSFKVLEIQSAEAYRKILQDDSSPTPQAFIFDIVPFFYPDIKANVEADFPTLKTPRLIAYNPEAAAEMIFRVGSITTKGSLQWLKQSIQDQSPESLKLTWEDIESVEQFAGGGPEPSSATQDRVSKAVKAYKKVMVENYRVMKIAGYEPFHLYERWTAKVDWTRERELNWPMSLFKYQEQAKRAEGFVGCFPSSVFKPEALEAAEKDPILGKGGYVELGWFESKPLGPLNGELQGFLDAQDAKSVVYVSFGTIMDCPRNLVHLLEFLKTEAIPYVYAGGGQHASLPENIKILLKDAEADGRACVPDWCDQIGVLAHPSIMCFVSHCGANSTIESILAGVPIIACAQKWDQVFLSAKIHQANLGIELIQYRTGHVVGRGIMHRPGEVCVATPEAMKMEIAQAIEDVRGYEGDQMRENLLQMAKEMRSKREGIWNEAVKEFAHKYR